MLGLNKHFNKLVRMIQGVVSLNKIRIIQKYFLKNNEMFIWV